jgi:hypothetical protein
VLEKLLARQEALQQQGVEQWAKTEYDDAIALANDGDAAYRQREFETAVSRYAAALAGLDALAEQADDVYADAVRRGTDAMGKGDSRTAATAFALALLIKPGDEAASHGAARAASLDQVLALLAAGDQKLSNSDPDGAREEYKRALALDAETRKARDGIAHATAMITDRDFARAMSLGYAAFEQGKLELARTQFNAALNIKPGAAEARSGLNQVQNRITSDRIGALLAEASAREGEEDWRGAAEKYDAALKLDTNLAAAQQGRQHVLARAALDDRLQRAISQPQRLNDPAVHDETATLLTEALNLGDAGPRLKKQITVLSTLLHEAATPVHVRIQSDNLTEVTIYRVGVLGRFESRDMTLLPGDYVAVGTREGYRDARVEFQIRAREQPPVIAVQCDQKIALGN